MDVKDVSSPGGVARSKAPAQSDSVESSKQRSSSSLTNSRATTIGSTAAVIAVNSKPPVNDANSARSRANQVIEAVNVASEATDEIDKLVKSIGGIVQQVSQGDVPDTHKQILEKEANDLVGEIKRQAQASTSSGIKPLAGDKIRVEVEQRIGKALDVILPTDANNAFGIGTIKFSRKEAIIQTQTNIATAEQRVEDLRKKVSDVRDQVTSVVTSLDVALQNAEASQASVRDVDAALKLVGSTKLKIGAEPEKALGSFTKLSSRSLELLD